MSTEGDRAEEPPTSREQELRLLVETIPALVWRAAPDGNFDYVNKRMLEYLGAPLSEVIGWGWMDKVHPGDVGFKVRSWLENLESGKPHDVVCRIRGADGRYRWFEVRGEPLRASDGAVLSWYGILIDIDDENGGGGPSRERIQAPSNHRNGTGSPLVNGPRWRADPRQSAHVGLLRSAV
jgi:PAS domain S-box-containing protein